ncbi:MAG TPA: hypothetical protein VMG12_23635 [Polyangiaceae bacterium]|nr:hypothetical protein [Polyangiaceae bacterium]
MQRLSLVRSACVACLALAAQPARAEPPGNWSVAIERLFGISRAWLRSNDGGPGEDQTSVSVFTQHQGGFGYSAPRVAVDYVLDLGLSFGGAFGFGKYRADYAYDDYRINAVLLAPRAGYLLTPTPTLAIWPRVGLTLTTSVRTGSEEDVSALTFEAPVVFLLRKHVVGLTVTPYFEYGFSGLDDYSPYNTVSELGVSIGGNAFF